ncbi:MAG: glutamate--tRNA ligase [Candidatus Omnitrophota bacterium]
MIRVRFAPSPTGFLHIGGARTALFNWIFAKSQKGAFVLRIEDTDALRSKKEYVDEILQSLDWLGFHWDEIYYQSQRYDIYREYADRLLKEGKAYLAEKLPPQEGQPGGAPRQTSGGQAVILKIHPQKIVITDLIRGGIEFDSAILKDQVLIKSDGTPTYNFACVVDDALMRITHIIRGDDHISNTPKQIILYEALGLPIPVFAHLPLILATEGGRLSKRKGATAISEFRSMGYLSKALVNFLLLLGWSPGENREVIEPSEAIKLFDIKHINKTAAALDLDKLNWINNQYLKAEDPEKLADEVIPLLAAKGIIDKDTVDRTYVRLVVELLQARLTTLNDFPERADFFFLNDPVMDPKAQAKFLSGDLSREFSLFCDRLAALPHFEISAIEEAFRQMVSELNLEAKVLIHPVRVALTGKTIGPGLFEVIYCLGKDRTIERLMKQVKTGG